MIVTADAACQTHAFRLPSLAAEHAPHPPDCNGLKWSQDGSIVARCPMCHLANEGSAYQCARCGYQFGQSLEKLEEMLLDQLSGARIAFWLFLRLDTALLAGVVFAMVKGYLLLPWLPFIALTWCTVRAGQKVTNSKHSLSLVEKQKPQLPKATLVT